MGMPVSGVMTPSCLWTTTVTARAIIARRRFLGSGGAAAARESSSEAIPEDAAARRLRREIKPWHGDGLCARSAGCSPEEEGISDFAPMLAELSTALLRCQSYTDLESR